MELHQLRLPTVAEYVTAFRAVQAKITDKQHEMLRVHHAAPARTISASRLAEAVGFENWTAANLQYGLLAGRLNDQLALNLAEHARVGVLVDFVDPGYAANEHWLWVMRPNVAQALEDLKWAPRVSHLLYPDLALEAQLREVTVEVFDAADGDDADGRFWTWYRQYPRGFYLNKQSATTMTLHAASCYHLSPDESGSATQKTKICSPERRALMDWAGQRGFSVENCRDCIE
jgi:hypothetical protein